MKIKPRRIKPKKFNAGDNSVIAEEEPVANIDFDIHKLNNRPKPDDPRQILLACCFSEFGCETVGVMYCLPHLFQQYPGHYKIVVGWHGREYFYRHLADEFWEIKKENMWLREHCRAFHHESKNLERIEKALTSHGQVIESAQLGRIAVGAKCGNCNAFWGTTDKVRQCPQCRKTDKLQQSILGDVSGWKPKAKRLPTPSSEKLALADKYLKPNPVGVFARGRKCYGRNLSPEFYTELVKLLEDMGYNPVWLGEEATTQPCPVDHVVDFSRMPEARDLETTLAIISKCKFTVQFWTASTRLAGMMGIPYLLFESPDQIWGAGQEGFRRNLCDFGERKLAINHYLSVRENPDEALNIVRLCIEEMEEDNFEDVIGLVESDMAVKAMMKDNYRRIGGKSV